MGKNFKFCLLLVAFREEHRLTQEEMAKLLDIDRSYLSQLENDKREPSKRLRRRLEALTQQDVDNVTNQHGELYARKNITDLEEKIEFQKDGIKFDSVKEEPKAYTVRNLRQAMDDIYSAISTKDLAHQLIQESERYWNSKSPQESLTILGGINQLVSVLKTRTDWPQEHLRRNVETIKQHKTRTTTETHIHEIE